jgi:DNA-directed RNA polymerase subunit RPC12/RpoP
MSYACEVCGKKFESKRGLSVHKARAHRAGAKS